MTDPRPILLRALALAVLLFALPPVTLAEASIRELTYLDRQYMQQQREQLDDLARRNLGRQFNGGRDNDLQLLQLLLDRKLVRDQQKTELQAMGMVLGDLLADELDMHWVVYEDHVGRSRALRYRDSDNFLFPVTMISRRREAGSDTAVGDMYQRAVDIIAPLRNPLPFR